MTTADVRLEEQEEEDEEVTADWERRKRKTKERKPDEQRPDGPRPAGRFRRAETPPIEPTSLGKLHVRVANHDLYRPAAVVGAALVEL